MTEHAVIWHDLECHGYVEDLPLWQELAAAAAGPVLEVGAGTGRVALDLAAAGFEVTALDSDPVLLAELSARAHRRGLAVETICADAGALGADAGLGTFGAVIVPMQTVQLLADREAFFSGVRRVLRPGGVLAMAIAEELETFEGDGEAGWLPEPDVGRKNGWEFVSQPTAIRVNGARAAIERVRRATAPDGTQTRITATIALNLVTSEQLEAEAAQHGLRPDRRRHEIPGTEIHVGSTVVMLRG